MTLQRTDEQVIAEQRSKEAVVKELRALLRRWGIRSTKSKRARQAIKIGATGSLRSSNLREREGRV